MLQVQASHPCSPTQVLVALAAASSGGTAATALRSSVPKQTVVGLFRDLRGITVATNSRRTYGGYPPSSVHNCSRKIVQGSNAPEGVGVSQQCNPHGAASGAAIVATG